MLQNKLKEDEWDLALSDALLSMNHTPHAATGFAPFEVVYNQPAGLFELDENVEEHNISPEKQRQRALISKRLNSRKTKQSLDSKFVESNLPMLQPDTVICVRYAPRSPKFFAKVRKDHGMSLTVTRCDPTGSIIAGNQHSTIKIAKRHVYLMKSHSYNINHVNSYEKLL